MFKRLTLRDTRRSKDQRQTELSCGFGVLLLTSAADLLACLGRADEAPLRAVVLRRDPSERERALSVGVRGCEYTWIAPFLASDGEVPSASKTSPSSDTPTRGRSDVTD